MDLTFIASRDVPAEEDVLDAYSQAVIRVAELLSPSVANLRVSRRVRGGRRMDGGGSGVVVTPDGFMLTSAHVVAAGTSGVRASFVDGSEVDYVESLQGAGFSVNNPKVVAACGCGQSFRTA